MALSCLMEPIRRDFLLKGRCNASLNIWSMVFFVTCDDLLIPKNKFTKFHLLYAGGLLKSAGKNKRAWEKHSIRRFLHLQMKLLWETHPDLREYAARTVAQRDAPDIPYLDALAKIHEKSGMRFIPLITADNGLVCELEILFLRPGRPGQIVANQVGDLDNRMKVLLDALPIPENATESE
jgi:hypothetical protein